MEGQQNERDNSTSSTEDREWAWLANVLAKNPGDWLRNKYPNYKNDRYRIAAKRRSITTANKTTKKGRAQNKKYVGRPRPRSRSHSRSSFHNRPIVGMVNTTHTTSPGVSVSKETERQETAVASGGKKNRKGMSLNVQAAVKRKKTGKKKDKPKKLPVLPDSDSELEFPGERRQKRQ